MHRRARIFEIRYPSPEICTQTSPYSTSHWTHAVEQRWCIELRLHQILEKCCGDRYLKVAPFEAPFETILESRARSTPGWPGSDDRCHNASDPRGCSAGARACGDACDVTGAVHGHHIGACTAEDPTSIGQSSRCQRPHPSRAKRQLK